MACKTYSCRASLYERPVNLEAAKKAHTEFRRTMRAAGLKVLTIRDILSFGVEDHMGARVELEELATKALQYEVEKGFKIQDLNEKVQHLWLGESYMIPYSGRVYLRPLQIQPRM